MARRRSPVRSRRPEPCIDSLTTGVSVDRFGYTACMSWRSSIGFLALLLCHGLASAAPAEQDFVGVLLPAQQIELTPASEGKIAAIHVELGQQVSKGETIARLDDSELRHRRLEIEADRKQAAVDLQAAESELRDASTRLQRREEMPELISREDLEEARRARTGARLAVETALAKLERLRATLAQLDRELEAGDLKAPFDGRVASRLLAAGDVAGPSRPVVRLVSDRTLIVRFAVPPARADDLARETPIAVHVAGHALPLSGEVLHVAPEVDAPSGMVFVEGTVTLEATETSPLVGRDVTVRVDRP